jgi:hypothetical protein
LLKKAQVTDYLLKKALITDYLLNGLGHGLLVEKAQVTDYLLKKAQVTARRNPCTELHLDGTSPPAPSDHCLA